MPLNSSNEVIFLFPPTQTAYYYYMNSFSYYFSSVESTLETLLSECCSRNAKIYHCKFNNIFFSPSIATS